MDPRWLKMARPVAALKQGRTDWYRIENKSPTVADVYIYDEIGYWGVTANDFVKELDALDVKNINLRVNSPGGEVGDGLAIYESIKRHPANVTGYNDGFALSAASFILQAADTRVASRNSMTMIHNASGLAIGTAKDMRELADLLDKMTQNVADIYTQRAGGTMSQWLEAMDNETWYSAQEAVDAGLADEVGDSADSSSTSNSWDLSIFNYKSRQEAPAPVINKAPAFQPDPIAFREALKEAFR